MKKDKTQERDEYYKLYREKRERERKKTKQWVIACSFFFDNAKSVYVVLDHVLHAARVHARYEAPFFTPEDLSDEDIACS